MRAAPRGAAAHATGVLVVTPSRPAPRERVNVRGRLPSHARRLLLQRRVDDHRWITLARGHSGPHGRFAFRTRAPKRPGVEVRYRVVAPVRRFHSRRWISTPVRRETTVAARGRLNLPDRLVQGRDVAATAQFTPPRRGRDVVLQTRQNRRWIDVTRARQTQTGTATFRLTALTTGTFTYRAVALPAHGAAAVITHARPITIVTPAPDPVKKIGWQTHAGGEPQHQSGDNRVVGRCHERPH